MMKRPADQCKLLFLYLLRCTSAAFASSRVSVNSGLVLSSTTSSSSTAAHSSVYPIISKATFATAAAGTALNQARSVTSLASSTATSSSSSSSSSCTSESLLLQQGGHIALRVAHKEDIPSIQRCNLATLPENYNYDFYARLLHLWPDLAIVAEHIPASSVVDNDDDDHSSSRSTNTNLPRNFGSFFGGGYDPMTAPRKTHIVGYVLGKVDLQPTTITTTVDECDGIVMNQDTTILYGHVTSLAILNPYRRRGLALHLMNQLHFQLREKHHVDAVGLHVRVSNEAAKRLYEQELGYTIEEVIPDYYQDGEDAYLMRKDLIHDLDNNKNVDATTTMRDNTWSRSTTTTNSPSTTTTSRNTVVADDTSSSLWLRQFVGLQRRTDRWKKVIGKFSLPRIVWDSENERELVQSILSKRDNNSISFSPPQALKEESSSSSTRLPELVNEISMSSSSSLSLPKHNFRYEGATNMNVDNEEKQQQQLMSGTTSSTSTRLLNNTF